jgi:hypothetical protein
MKKIFIKTEIVKDSSAMFPYDAEAWDMWGRVQSCHEKLFIKYYQEYDGDMTAWDCYQAFCQDCEEHDICFKNSDWFIHFIRG